MRTQLLAIGELQGRGSDWFGIEVTHVGDRITSVPNGNERLEVVDRTFPTAGGIGLWSDADSQGRGAGLWFASHEAR